MGLLPSTAREEKGSVKPSIKPAPAAMPATTAELAIDVLGAAGAGGARREGGPV